MYMIYWIISKFNILTHPGFGCFLFQFDWIISKFNILTHHIQPFNLKNCVEL